MSVPRLSWSIAMLVISVAFHFGAVLAFGVATRPVEIEGGGHASAAQLGASFADMVAGQAGVASPSPPDMAQPVTVQSLTPGPFVQTASSVAASLPAPMAAPSAVAPSVEATLSPNQPRIETLTPEQRPQTRPARATARASGNATRDAQRGDATGDQAAAEVSAGESQEVQPTSGQAEAHRFPSLVLRQIQRTRRDRINARGMAVVAFSIGAGGQLAGLSIAQSSGSSELDQAALNHLRRAAPFPPPPPQAQRQFSFEFMGR